MRLYRSQEMPGRWIGEDKHGGLVHWPAIPKGWAQRTPYTGGRRQLEELAPAMARGTGWPGGGRGPRARGDEPSKPVTIRVTAQERASWEHAAEEHDRTLSD